LPGAPAPLATHDLIGINSIECKSLAEHGDMIKQYQVTYFMISVDPQDGDKGNKAFAQKYEADFPILSDPDKTVARSYGVLSATGFPHRWTFYIGKDGRILDVDKNVHPNSHGPDIAKRLAVLGDFL